jgi:hypothetical protein
VAPSSEGICWKLEMTRSKTRVEQGLSCSGYVRIIGMDSIIFISQVHRQERTPGDLLDGGNKQEQSPPLPVFDDQ